MAMSLHLSPEPRTVENRSSADFIEWSLIIKQRNEWIRLSPTMPTCLWHIPSWLYSILILEAKIPTTYSLRSKWQAGASDSDLFVGNATALWWTFKVIQHYYVSDIIYGLIQGQLYNCIIVIYLHLENINHSEIFHFERLHVGSRAKPRKVCSSNCGGQQQAWKTGLTGQVLAYLSVPALPLSPPHTPESLCRSHFHFLNMQCVFTLCPWEFRKLGEHVTSPTAPSPPGISWIWWCMK